MDKKIGHILPVQVAGETQEVPWLGHARSETLEKNGFLPNQQMGTITPKEYTEKGVPFKVPPGKSIEVVITTSSNFPSGKGAFIVTRPASAEELKRCPYPRHPKFK